MGPFARASKLDSRQKRGGQSSRESYSKGPDSPNETDQRTFNQDRASKDILNCSPRNRSGTSLTRGEDLACKREKVHPGQESIHRTLNLQKEPCQVIYNPRSRGKKKSKLEDNVDSFGEGSIGSTFEKLHVYEVDDLGTKAQSGMQTSYVHAGSLQEAPSQTAFTEKPDDDQFKYTYTYTNRNQYPVTAAESLKKKASETDLFIAGESSERHVSSLSLSLGLNRIKTRSGPLSEDGSDQSSSIAKAGAEGAEKSSLSEIRKEHGLFTKQVDAITGKNSHCFSGGEQCQRSNEQSCQEGRALSGDFRSRDRGTSSGCRVGSSKLQRVALHSPKMSSLARGNSDGFPASVLGQIEANSNLLSSITQPFDYLQLKSTESYKASPKRDHPSEKKVASDSSSYIDCKTPAMEGSYKQLDVIKETELTKFKTVPKISEGSKKKKWPKDIKSFSHELGPRGGRPYGHPRPHSDNDLEELLGALHARFNTAKEEVDSELGVFAGDLIEILDKNVDPFPDWKEKIEDLLILARRCTVMSAADFRRECESIVHDLDDKRQELPMGLLKQLHIRMLFILTRCTRLLQFQKGSSPDEEGLHKVQQCLKGVPSLEKAWTSVAVKKGKATSNNKKLLTDIFERTGKNEGKHSVVKHLKSAQKSKCLSDRLEILNQSNELDSCGVLASPTKSSGLVDEAHDKTEITDDWVARSLKDSTIKPLQERWDYLETVKTSSDDEFQETLVQSATSPKLIEQENIIDEPDSVICRICEEEVPTSRLEAHSFICALADTCDIQGLNLDERLKMLADNLEKLSELNTPISYQPAVGESPDSIRPFKFHEASDGTSPKVTDSYGRLTEARLEDFCAVDNTAMEEPRGISLLSFKPYLGSKADQVMPPSSTGSGTPRSTLTTPRNSQLDLLWTERNSLTELEDVSQIFELADIARCVASKSSTDERVLEYLLACMQDLQEVLARNKIEALTVDTFGKRILNLLREKYLLICENNDHRKVNMPSSSVDEDVFSADDGLNSLKSTPTHPAYKDRTTIDDFEILKPISRGAFGRVFLARKRTTGDLFAIKVLRKIDMIRKNAVENILAERDILISVRNPFVVRFFYSFTCRDNLYLVMEYLNGGDLYSLLRNMGCLEEHVAKVYIAELVLALEYLHSLGVVHRDLKPDNILIAHDGHIKLTDFGLSKVGLINSTDDLSGPGASGTVLMDEDCYRNSSEHPQPTERRNRSAVGTPDYLAPEILLGTEHGYTADWWSTGIILFEFLTGLPPFNAEHPQIIFDNILNRKIPWPRIPEEMTFEAKDLIDKLLTEDPNQRLGAKGATEVKAHPFFKDINWDTLARQKAAFVPNPESIDDTSYFTSRHLETHSNSAQDFADSSDCSISTASMNSLKAKAEEGADDFGDLAEFESSPTVRHTFNNFSFKNLSQLASINYDLLLQTGKDHSKGHSRHSSTS